jgi:hypothetical protein
MSARRLWIPALLVAGLVLPAAGALANGHCNVPLADWQPREALQRKLEEQGWTVIAIRVDDGCYKVRAVNALGERLDGKFDPARLEPMTGWRHGHGHDHGHGGGPDDQDEN